MKKVPILRKNLNTIAKYLYRSELHGEFEEFVLALQEVFELVEKILPKRRPMRIRKRKPEAPKKRRQPHLPPPIPVQAMVNKYAGITVHRATKTLRTICGTLGSEVVTTLDDSRVNCYNCLLPKHQAKILRDERSQESDRKVGNYHPPDGLPEVPHFLSSNSSEM